MGTANYSSKEIREYVFPDEQLYEHLQLYFSFFF